MPQAAVGISRVAAIKFRGVASVGNNVAFLKVRPRANQIPPSPTTPFSPTMIVLDVLSVMSLILVLLFGYKKTL